MHDLTRRVQKLETAANHDAPFVVVGADRAEIDSRLAALPFVPPNVIAFITGVPRAHRRPLGDRGDWPPKSYGGSSRWKRAPEEPSCAN